MKRLIKKHPLAIRWFHWVNFPLLALMIWSGLMIYWASSDNHLSSGVYRIGWGNTTVYHFFPPGFWSALGLSGQLAKGMAWHFFLMWFFAINGLVYVAYTVISGEWRHLIPGRHAVRDAWQVMLHDLHLRNQPLTFDHYNPAQQIAYTLVVLMGGGSLITGLAIFRPVQIGWLTDCLGGYEWARREHFWLTMGYLVFFIVHILQVARAGWNNFRSIIVGYEIRETEKVEK